MAPTKIQGSSTQASSKFEYLLTMRILFSQIILHLRCGLLIGRLGIWSTEKVTGVGSRITHDSENYGVCKMVWSQFLQARKIVH